MAHLPIDSAVHHAVLSTIIADGAAPTVDELAARLGADAATIAGSLDRLAANHGLVLHPGTHDIWIAHPFSLSPTAVWVEAGARGWWAPCLWCALGVATLIEADVTIHVRAGGEATPLPVHVVDGAVVERDLVVHFPMPPSRAWDNVVHFCSMLLPFPDVAALDAWCARHRTPRGEALPIEKVWDLAKKWYGSHLTPDWVKHTVSEARVIFMDIGLTGPFWDLFGSKRF
jgi:hypothetical protein